MNINNYQQCINIWCTNIWLLKSINDLDNYILNQNISFENISADTYDNTSYFYIITNLVSDYNIDPYKVISIFLRTTNNFSNNVVSLEYLERSDLLIIRCPVLFTDANFSISVWYRI